MISHFNTNSRYSKRKLSSLVVQQSIELCNFVKEESPLFFYTNHSTYGFSFYIQHSTDAPDKKTRTCKIKILVLEDKIFTISDEVGSLLLKPITNIENLFKLSVETYTNILSAIRNRGRAFERQMQGRTINPRPLNEMRAACFRLEHVISNQIDILNDLLVYELSNKSVLKDLSVKLNKIRTRDISSLIKELESKKEDYIFVNNIKFTRSIHLLTTFSVIMFPLHMVTHALPGNWWLYFDLIILVVVIFHIVRFQIEDKEIRKEI